MMKRNKFEPLFHIMIFGLCCLIPFYMMGYPISANKMDKTVLLGLLIISIFIINISCIRFIFFDSSIDFLKPTSLRYQLLIRLFTYFISIIIIYTNIYCGLISINDKSFHNPDSGKGMSYLDFFYFSTTTFATVGYGDIYPKSSYAKSMVILEILNSLFILIILISNFDFLKNRFIKNKE